MVLSYIFINNTFQEEIEEEEEQEEELDVIDESLGKEEEEEEEKGMLRQGSWLKVGLPTILVIVVCCYFGRKFKQIN